MFPGRWVLDDLGVQAVTLSVAPDGTLSFIYTDDVDRFALQEDLGGELLVRRASMVEPTTASGWEADLSPVGGPVLGPFINRAAALAAEVAWLQENVL